LLLYILLAGFHGTLFGPKDIDILQFPFL
jgi:hypothetical protein